MLRTESDRIVFHYDTEELWIEPWGENALRIRATKQCSMPQNNWALQDRTETACRIRQTEDAAEIENGKIRAVISRFGKIEIYNREGKILLEEYWRNRRDVTDSKCSAIEVEGREFPGGRPTLEGFTAEIRMISNSGSCLCAGFSGGHSARL